MQTASQGIQILSCRYFLHLITYKISIHLFIPPSMFRVDFYEPELLHPASLDFVGSLPNLKHLMVTNPSVIGNLTNKYLNILSHHHHTLLGDDMFLELPELCSSPFPRVETIVYEGSITSQVKTPSYLILILSNSRQYYGRHSLSL